MNSEQVFTGLGIGLGVVGVFVILTMILVTIGIAVIVSRMFATAKSDRKAARMQVSAKILARRTRIANRSDSGFVRTCCYVTFETDRGDRVELLVPEREYGVLLEGDEGILTYQGTRFISFHRR